MNVRKKATSLSDEEWERYLKAVVTLKHTFAAGSNVSTYDQFVAIHWGVTRLSGAQTIDGGHQNPGFFPWHREYLKRYEQALQSVDARVTIPYWDWGNGDDETEISQLFTESRMGPLGTGGGSIGPVTSGAFSANGNNLNPMGWTIHPNLRAQALPNNNLHRTTQFIDLSSPWPTGTVISNLLAENDFHLFRPGLEWPPHGIVHVRMDGDMRQMTSPNDPIFFMHHAQVDRLWAQWQKSHPGSANYNPRNLAGPGHTVDTAMWPWDNGASQTTTPGIANLLPRFPETDVVRPLDVLNHRDMGYCYDDEEGCPCARSIVRFPQAPRGEVFTTFRTGEEIPATFFPGEDITTFALGEELPPFPPTDPRIDDPVPPFRDRFGTVTDPQVGNIFGRF